MARASLGLLLSAAALAAPPTLPNETFIFDAPFGDNMVLQQAPSQSAVYGYLPFAATGVTVTVEDAATGHVVATVAATLNVTVQPFGPDWGVRPCPKADCPPYDMEPFRPWSVAIPSWKALLPAMPAGGNFTITATCSGCEGNSTLVLRSATFGDVWYCSGQVRARAVSSRT